MSNDRFKFRLWDNLNRRYVKDMQIDQQGDICYSNGSKYCNGEHNEDFTVEQCTGVKDQNGVLIYEGDLVEVYNPLTDAYNECRVMWECDSAGYVCVYTQPQNVVRGCQFASSSGTYLDGAYSRVIGNIHDEAEK